jgi:hypothetical protein
MLSEIPARKPRRKAKNVREVAQTRLEQARHAIREARLML